MYVFLQWYIQTENKVQNEYVLKVLMYYWTTLITVSALNQPIYVCNIAQLETNIIYLIYNVHLRIL